MFNWVLDTPLLPTNQSVRHWNFIKTCALLGSNYSNINVVAKIKFQTNFLELFTILLSATDISSVCHNVPWKFLFKKQCIHNRHDQIFQLVNPSYAPGLFLYPLKQKTSSFLFSGGIERDEWHEMAEQTIS